MGFCRDETLFNAFRGSGKMTVMKKKKVQHASKVVMVCQQCPMAPSNEEDDRFAAPLLNTYISRMMLESQAAFEEELPALLESHAGLWVAYHGRKRLGFAPTETELLDAHSGLRDVYTDLVANI